MRRAGAILFVASLFSACSADLKEGHYNCTTAAQCPTAWFCVGGLCYSSAAGDTDAGPRDAGPPFDAGPDFDAGPPPPDAGGCVCDEDGNLCTTESCATGTCVHAAVVCGTNETCGPDGTCSCQAGFTRCTGVGCVNTLGDPMHCGAACTACGSGISCLSGVCGMCSSAAQCDDLNPCTTDDCVASNCTHVNNDALACSDGTLCTSGDHCSAGSCVATPVSCDDGQVCTMNTCNPASGCAYPPVPGPCDDGDDCTVGDACAAGLCRPGGPRSCPSDGNECTVEACVDGSCGSTDVAEGTLCGGSTGSEGRYHCSGGGCRDLHNCCTATACSTTIRSLCDMYGCCSGCPGAGACAGWTG